MEGVTVYGHHPECRVTFGRGGPHIVWKHPRTNHRHDRTSLETISNVPLHIPPQRSLLESRTALRRNSCLWYTKRDFYSDVYTIYEISKIVYVLKQQNRYLSVIIVCGYFSLTRSLTWLNFLSKSNSYHKTSLSMSFGCWHLSGIPLCPLYFTVYTIAWQRKFERQWVFNINLCIVSG